LAAFGVLGFLFRWLGRFLAIPMKRQMINHEQLPFPTGTAAAVTLRSLYTAGREAVHKAYALLVTLAVGVFVGVLRTYGTLVDELDKTKWSTPWLTKLKGWFYIPEQLNFTGFLNPLKRGTMSGLCLEPSVLLIGAGMIVGNRVNLSMLGGSILLYYIVAPPMLAHDLANADVAGYVRAFGLSRKAISIRSLGVMGRHVIDGFRKPDNAGVRLEIRGPSVYRIPSQVRTGAQRAARRD